MKKFAGWVGGVVVLVGVYTASAYWIGQESAKKYHQFLNQVSDEYQLAVRNERFSSGLLESTAHTVIDLSASGFFKRMTPEQQLKLRESPNRFINLNHRISHGPLAVATNNVAPALAVIKTTVDWTPEQSEILKTIFADENPLEITTVIGFDGDSNSHISIAEIHQNNNGVKVDWSGFQLDLLVNKDGDSAEYTFSSSELFASFDKGVFNVKNIHGSGDLIRSNSYFWNGDSVLNIESFEINPIDKKNHPVKINMANFAMNTSQTMNNDLFNISNRITLEKLKLPEFDMHAGVFDMEFNNLDYETFSELQEAQEVLAANPNMTEEQRQAQLTMNMFSMVPKLLSKSPEINVNELSFKTDDGMGKAVLLVKYQAEDNTPVNFSGPNAIMMQLRANLTIDVTEQLATKLAAAQSQKQITQQLAAQGVTRTKQEIEAQSKAMVNQQIDMLAAQKLIVKEKGLLTTKVKFENANYTVNGNPANEIVEMFMGGSNGV